MKNIIKKFIHVNLLVGLSAVTLIAVNLNALAKPYTRAVKFKNKTKYFKPGFQFDEFNQYLDGVQKAGFLTNKNMSPEKNDGKFLEAQYAFAPTVLELNNPDNEYFIVDARNITDAFDILSAVGAEPVHVNKYSKILARKTK